MLNREEITKLPFVHQSVSQEHNPIHCKLSKHHRAPYCLLNGGKQLLFVVKYYSSTGDFGPFVAVLEITSDLSIGKKRDYGFPTTFD